MVDKLYLEHMYMKSFKAKVIAVEKSEILLDKTAFYPTGGGQPCDTGTINTGHATYNVVEVIKKGDDVVHRIDREGIMVGDEVSCDLDWKKRYMHMRFHTALHILDGVVSKKHNGLMTGGQIYDDKARADFDVPGLDREGVLGLINAAQAIVDEGHAVEAKFMSNDEASKITNLARTAPGEELMKSMASVRIIDIVGFDFQMDGGTHVANTKEVGKISLLKYENKGSHNKRIEISLE
ncbi:MAG: alanyl-tRNA editing protein [Candidatus Marsarchaeota archaeon]|nr:alanyl-tRNA editing protein [Candidatus Marsarchaeota archaeon]